VICNAVYRKRVGGVPSHVDRQRAQKNLVKIMCVVSEIILADRQTDSSQYFATAPTVKVMTTMNLPYNTGFYTNAFATRQRL